MSPEPFVSAETAAQFLSITRRHLLALARRGMAGSYPLGSGTQRRVWVFRLSELAAAVANQQRNDPQNLATMRSSRTGNLHAGKRTA